LAVKTPLTHVNVTEAHRRHQPALTGRAGAPARLVQTVVNKVLEVRSPRTAINNYTVLSEMLGEAVRWGKA
jgi:hypothetical protein